MTSPSFPAALDALANPGPTTETDDAGFELDVVIARLQNCVMAIEGKLGIGGAGPPGTDAVLRRTATGASAWGGLLATDMPANTISRVSTVVGTTADPSTASASEAGLAQMVMTGLVGVVGAAAIVLFETMVRSSVAGDNMQFTIYRDGTALASRYVAAPVSGYNLLVTLVAVFTVPAVSYNVSVNFSRVTGSGTVTCASTQRSLTVIELRR